MTSLRLRMTEDMQVRISRSTRKVMCNRSLCLHDFNKSPEQLGPEDIRAYQVYLTMRRSWRPAPCSSRYRRCASLQTAGLEKDWQFDEVIPAPKKPLKLAGGFEPRRGHARSAAVDEQ